MYVLASGHPRTIEFLIEKLERYEEEDWMDIRSCLSDKTKSFGDLLKKVLEITESPYSLIGGMDKSLMSEFVFRFPVFRDVKDMSFRMLIEEGSLLIYNRVKNTSRFITCVQLQSILYLIQSAQWSSFEKSEDERLKIAYYFLQGLLSCSGIGIMWERIVSLNIVIRSFEEMTISDIFGIDYYNTTLGENKNDIFKIKINHGSNRLFTICYILIYSVDIF